MAHFLSRILGDPNKQAVAKLKPILTLINSFEPSIQALTDEQLRDKTAEFKERLAQGAALDNLLPEAFAVVREAAKRVLGERHFDVQLMGGIVLHQGKIAEMRTGEGKTLVATLPVYLNALTGKGVHVVTVNDYLAKRDSEWMGKIYEFLGLTVGVVTHEKDTAGRREAYAADVTYGTNNEFGFDYLRDNMAPAKEEQVQRLLHFAIVDEVDSILVDEARTPLIISAPAEESTDHYRRFALIVPQLTKEIDYTVDEKMRSAILTEPGIEKVQRLLGIDDIYESGDVLLAHHIEQALRAHTVYKLDVDYVVKDGEVLIVDEFTGRLMPGRRYSEGLHQAIEAKEKVEVKRESRTYATITFQNYFRLFEKLSGMTGTAKTEEEEFWKIYGLEVITIPTNKEMIRRDLNDLIYVSEKAKFDAVVKEIQRRHETGQPILVGTIAIEKSELLSNLLKREGVAHEVLNAKHHEREAEIVKDAGQKNAVTIATNMAGRGTDIKLGEGVVELGGLHILGTERHESRRIDNQLRGRAGRQGDPGRTQFFVSMEDDLMRLFGSERMKNMMRTLKIPEDQPLEHKMISSSIESAQKRVEGHNFDIRKRVVEFDDVMNRHRTTVYRQRQKILEQGDVKETVQNHLFDELRLLANLWVAGDNKTMIDSVQAIMPLSGKLQEAINNAGTAEAVKELLVQEAEKQYTAKETEVGAEFFRQVERAVLLRVMDLMWMEHLDALVRLREAVGLRGYGQRDPLTEYKQEAYAMFQRLQAAIAEDVARMILRVKFTAPPEQQKQAEELEEKKKLALKGAENPGFAKATPDANVNLQGGAEPTGDFEEEEKELGASPSAEDNKVAPRSLGEASSSSRSVSPTNGGDALVNRAVRDPQERHKDKVGRNDPCPCGSGKKYKKCHGA
ncbi:MAG: preprotein translocase subunit SecA [bacterium]